jgi:hypothetical protein
MSIEPMAARKGLDEMANLLIAAYSLVAQLSAARLAVQTGAPAPDPAICDWLQTLLAGQSSPAAPASGPLSTAALAVTSAAGNYERVAKSEAS